jgi:hypothetical protein
MRANQDRQGHLLHAQSGRHRVPAAPSRRALKTRKETMNGIWRSPERKPKTATRSGQRTTTSTPNIISDRCPRIQKGRKKLVVRIPDPHDGQFGRGATRVCRSIGRSPMMTRRGGKVISDDYPQRGQLHDRPPRPRSLCRALTIGNPDDVLTGSD